MISVVRTGSIIGLHSMWLRATLRLVGTVRNKATSTSSLSGDNGDVPGELQPSTKPTMPFSRAKIGPFFQQMPVLGNQFLEDVTLQSFLRRKMPAEVYASIAPDLSRFGDRVATDLYDLHLECERNPPRLHQYDAWGRRVDTIVTCEAWKKMKTASAEEGLIATAYERDFAEWSRLYQLSKLYLFSPSSGLYSCPLAMTDGAAKILEIVGDAGLMERAYSRLTSRDPEKFWTSGQWMTERRGGSDVANGTETLAVPQSDGSYKLYGYKWFSSATDSDMAVTLARVLDHQGNTVPGTRGLSTFYLEVREDDGSLNNIEVQRLKDKLGTRQLPTAELLLDGVKAYRISDEGRGVAGIAHMLTLTRIHNTLAAAGAMRRIVNFARDYSHKRTAFGHVIKYHKLHIKTMAAMEVEARSALLLMLEVGTLLGREELGKASENDKLLLRLLTPLAKLYTAKQAMSVISEGLECFGGAGYLEDTGLPLLLRDAQVLTIWEGTTNILSLDTLRALAKSQGVSLVAYHESISAKLASAASDEQLAHCCEKLSEASKNIMHFAQQHTDKLEMAARDFAYSLARTYMGALLVEHAGSPGSTDADRLAAVRWCEQDLCPIIAKLNSAQFEGATAEDEYELVMAGYTTTK